VKEILLDANVDQQEVRVRFDGQGNRCGLAWIQLSLEGATQRLVLDRACGQPSRRADLFDPRLAGTPS